MTNVGYVEDRMRTISPVSRILQLRGEILEDVTLQSNLGPTTVTTVMKLGYPQDLNWISTKYIVRNDRHRPWDWVGINKLGRSAELHGHHYRFLRTATASDVYLKSSFTNIITGLLFTSF